MREGVRDFTLNLDGVQYVDSAGLGQLVQLYTTVTHLGADFKLVGLTNRMTSLLRLTKLLEGPENDNFMELPDPLSPRRPALNPMIWLVLLVTLAILVTFASRVPFGTW